MHTYSGFGSARETLSCTARCDRDGRCAVLLVRDVVAAIGEGDVGGEKQNQQTGDHAHRAISYGGLRVPVPGRAHDPIRAAGDRCRGLRGSCLAAVHGTNIPGNNALGLRFTCVRPAFLLGRRGGRAHRAIARQTPSRLRNRCGTAGADRPSSRCSPCRAAAQRRPRRWGAESGGSRT